MKWTLGLLSNPARLKIKEQAQRWDDFSKQKISEESEIDPRILTPRSMLVPIGRDKDIWDIMEGTDFGVRQI